MHKKGSVKTDRVMHKKGSVKTDRVPPPAVTVDVPPMKILFLGNENVGKTTFIRAYTNYLRNFFRIETYVGFYLVFTQYVLNVERHGRHFSVWLLDLPTGSTAEHRANQYPASVDIVVLCYAVDDSNSLDSVLTFWLLEMERHYENSLPRYHLLGLKSDLRNNQGRIEALAREGRRPVALLDVLEVHQNFHSFSREYMECSALTDPDQAIYCMKTLIDHLFFYRRLHLPI